MGADRLHGPVHLVILKTDADFVGLEGLHLELGHIHLHLHLVVLLIARLTVDRPAVAAAELLSVAGVPDLHHHHGSESADGADGGPGNLPGGVELVGVGVEGEGVGEDGHLVPLILQLYDGAGLASVQIQEK